MGYRPKMRETKKEIMASYKRKICVPFCGLQTMLTMEDPWYYTYGTNGWNADIYHVDLETVIVTGYRPFGNFTPKYEVTKRYEDRAQKIYDEFRWVTDYDDIRNRLRNLIKEFVKEVCGDE